MMTLDYNKKFQNQKNKQSDFNCSLGFAMTVIGSKWRAIVLWHILKSDSIRYGELKKSIPKITHKVFSNELKILESDNLIGRIVYDTNPPKVEYFATPLGKTLEPILSDLCEWGKTHIHFFEEE